MKNPVLFSFIIWVLISCEPRYKYDSGDLPVMPENLEAFNSAQDDYNATSPILGSFTALCFSTNRYSNGAQFDIIYKPMTVTFGKSTGILNIFDNYVGWGGYQFYDELFNNVLGIINTPGNEYGPHFIVNHSTAYQDYEYLLLYASDLDGDLDIRFTFKIQQDSVFMESLPIELLNSQYDDAYPFVDFDRSTLFFCSNRDEKSFNIYELKVPDPYNNLLSELINAPPRNITRNTILSSEYDDKCPFVLNNMLVYASNRPEGYGGYDLYYSLYENDSWSTPRNLGPNVNSEYDEFRPILINEGVDTDKYMMVFSSNREGGKGGFDLYFVGVDIAL